MHTSLTKLFFLTAAALTLSAPGLHAQTVTSQITGTYPTFSWPEWDQASSLNVSINTDPNPAGIFGCWTGLLLNVYPGYSQTGPWRAAWNMTVPTAGQYMLEFEYAMDASSLRPGNVTVNSALVASNVIGAPTGGWCTSNLLWAPLTAVPLNAGSNAIRWDRTGGLYTPHFRGIRLKKMDAPVVSKTFSPASALVNAGGGTVTSTVTVQLANPGNATGYTGPLTTTADFTDTLPGGVVLAATPNASTDCNSTSTSAPLAATAGGTSVSLPANSTVPAGGCSMRFDVTVPTSAVADFDNTIAAGALQTNGGNSAAAAQARFQVTAPTPTAVPTLHGGWLALLAVLLAAFAKPLLRYSQRR